MPTSSIRTRREAEPRPAAERLAALAGARGVESMGVTRSSCRLAMSPPADAGDAEV